MRDFYLIFCVISLFAGVSSISISYFVYKNNEKKSLKFFIALNLSFFSIQNTITLNLYSKSVEQVSLFIPLLAKLLDTIGTSFSSLFGLFFINYIFGMKITTIKKNMFFLISGFQFLGILVYYLLKTPYILKFIINSSVIIVVFYEIFVIVKNYKQVINNDLKQAIRIFGVVTLVFLPFLSIESYRNHIKYLKNIEFFKVAALPAYFLVINIFTLIFALKYFNAPAFISNNKLTEYFKEKYDITEKQSEIIELIMEGLTYKQIAEKLFVAPKTVDNHLQNIYKKLNVKSKLQLCNFVRSNEK